MRTPCIGEQRNRQGATKQYKRIHRLKHAWETESKSVREVLT